MHRGGTYVCMEGPQFSTKAESLLYRSWGVDVIGMTNATEAKLCREAGIAYASACLVTDYDCWHEEEGPVSVEAVLAVLKENAATANRVLANAVARLDPARPSDCADALAFAVLTPPSARPRPHPEEARAPHAERTSMTPPRIVVTGSVAFDYLMTFPGKFLDVVVPDRMSRLSVSFLVDSMRRVRGGVAPNIAYGLALFGLKPVIMATAGVDALDYARWLAEEGVDTSELHISDDLFTASFFVSTDEVQNQIATFYMGAMARAVDLSFRAFGRAPCRSR